MVQLALEGSLETKTFRGDADGIDRDYQKSLS